MPVVMIATYEVRCDGEGCSGEETLGVGSFLDRSEAAREAVGLGWLKRGRKMYCPECRPRYECPAGSGRSGRG